MIGSTRPRFTVTLANTVARTLLGFWRKSESPPVHLRRPLQAARIMPPFAAGIPMALTATIRKAELQISDLDRGYYATHNLTLAQHPSETDERLMARLLAFALFARDRLEFGKGLSTDDEPDLWQRDYTGGIALWIDLGQPDESRVRKACNRAAEVVVVNYGGNAAEMWWKKYASALARFGNLRVIDIDAATVEALARRIQRGMRFQVLVQDGEVQWFGDDGEALAFVPGVRKAAPA